MKIVYRQYLIDYPIWGDSIFTNFQQALLAILPTRYWSVEIIHSGRKDHSRLGVLDRCYMYTYLKVSQSPEEENRQHFLSRDDYLSLSTNIERLHNPHLIPCDISIGRLQLQ